MEKILYLKTKLDKNGNSYYRVINFETKRIYNDVNLWKDKSDCIELPNKKALHNATDLFINLGFKQTIKLH